MSGLLSGIVIFMTDSITEVGVQHWEWQATLRLFRQQYVQVWGNELHMLPSHPTLGKFQGFH